MDIEEIRRENINFWADKLGRSVLAEKMGYKDTVYLNLLCGGHGSFGKNTARKAETALGLERGWFDRSHKRPDIDSKLNKLVEEIKDFDVRDIAELLAQVDLIKRRKSGLF